jgi:ribonucleoside-diphosphate reductase alpha chain
VNQTIPFALHRLGYSQETIEAIVDHISQHGHVVDAPGLKTEHYAIFDTAVGIRAIEPMGHVRMMAAVQPFLSGAISKTVNMPETATKEEIADVYFQGWKFGLKALAIYRDNCKVGQPLSDAKAKTEEKVAPAAVVGELAHPVRKRLPKSRPSSTTSFTVGGAEGYMTASSYPDGGLGEVFLKLGKQGSTLAGVMDAFSISVSIGLQYGVPLETFVKKFTNVNFEPAGLTDDADIRMAKSLMDYIFRRLALDYLPYETRTALGINSASERSAALDAAGGYPPVVEAIAPAVVAAVEEVEAIVEVSAQAIIIEEKPAPAREVHSSAELFDLLQGKESDAPLCFNCGIKMRPSGSCHVCEGCGSTSGCS